jgi:hypothetical protein
MDSRSNRCFSMFHFTAMPRQDRLRCRPTTARHCTCASCSRPAFPQSLDHILSPTAQTASDAATLARSHQLPWHLLVPHHLPLVMSMRPRLEHAKLRLDTRLHAAAVSCKTGTQQLQSWSTFLWSYGAPQSTACLAACTAERGMASWRVLHTRCACILHACMALYLL